jgi:glycosyltransferase involved in cell wall biosynthesis
MIRLLYLYKWCTFGGVERVLLNRAFAFKKYGIPVKMDVYFYYRGVISYFKKYIEKYNLSEYIDIIEILNFKKYDYIVSIDTEEAFIDDGPKNIILEYHTPYKDHGSYLTKVPLDKVMLVVVPSAYFKDVLKKRRADLAEKAVVLRNFVIEEAFDTSYYYLPDWSLRPIIWIGRTDRLKNPHFINKALRKFRDNYGDKILFCVVGSSIDEENFIKCIKEKKQIDRVVFYPNINYERVGAFLRQMRQKGAIFVSASMGESFGMAVAEAIYFELPVLVTDIPPHRDLVQNNKLFLYKIDNINEFISKLNSIIQNYSECQNKIISLKENLTPENFIKDWENFYKLVSKI